MKNRSSVVEPPSWRVLLLGANAIRTLVLCGAVILHALNLYVAATILPSVVRDIGGIEYYAWNTSLFVIGSIAGAAFGGPLLGRIGARSAYLYAALVFAGGCAICALAPAMPVLIGGRIVQGLGGGALLALPYAMIRIVFPQALWSRALALVSGMWGVATLLGPAFGGALANAGLWRGAFGLMVPVALVFGSVAVRVLPPLDGTRQAQQIGLQQLSILSLGVLAVSLASIEETSIWQAFGVVLGLGLMVLLVRVERRSEARLLPRDALRPGSTLGSLYAMMALLAVTVTCTEVFVPLFLQELHGLGPFLAGVLAAGMSAGWTAGSIALSGAGPDRTMRILRAAPWVSAGGMLVLAILLPQGGKGDWPSLMPLVFGLLVVGIGVGSAWPHLAALVMQNAPAGEEDLASSSIMTVQLVATAVSAAVAGVVLNASGLATPAEVATAASRLLGLIVLVPLIGLLLPRPYMAISASS